jgi:hypothetical protein
MFQTPESMTFYIEQILVFVVKKPIKIHFSAF